MRSFSRILDRVIRGTVFCVVGFVAMMSVAASFEIETPNGEKVTVEIPDGFDHVFTSNSPVSMYEFVPSGESMTNWSEMITVTRTEGSFLDKEGTLKYWGWANLQGFLSVCSSVLLDPSIDQQFSGALKSVSTSIGCVTKEQVRGNAQIDVRENEFLAITYVQGKEHIYALQRAIHFDRLPDQNGTSLEEALVRHNANLSYTQNVLHVCCGG